MTASNEDEWKYDPAFRAEVTRILQKLGAIQAVKYVMQDRGVGLAPAKAFVDSLTTVSSPPNTVRVGGIAWAALALVVLALAFSAVRSGNSGGQEPSDAPSVGMGASRRATATNSPSPARPVAGSQWTYTRSEDQMTGGNNYFASVVSVNQVDFGFPYNGPQRGRLTIRRHARFGSDVLFAIERGQISCQSYDPCSVLVRFDDAEPSTFSGIGPEDNDNTTVFIRNYERFTSRLVRANRVRIALTVYQEGQQVFEFDVSGFDAQKYRGKSTP